MPFQTKHVKNILADNPCPTQANRQAVLLEKLK